MVQHDEERIDEEFGKFYAECGRELLWAREQLRSGDQRVAFLDEHAEEIRDLSDRIDVSG